MEELFVGLLGVVIREGVLITLVAILVLTVNDFSVVRLSGRLVPPMAVSNTCIRIGTNRVTTVRIRQSVAGPLRRRVEKVRKMRSISSASTVKQDSLRVAFRRNQNSRLFGRMRATTGTTGNRGTTVASIASKRCKAARDCRFCVSMSNNDVRSVATFTGGILRPHLRTVPRIHSMSLTKIRRRRMVVRLSHDGLTRGKLSSATIVNTVRRIGDRTALKRLDESTDSPSLH